jgi:GT2 family glycosyltransferase
VAVAVLIVNYHAYDELDRALTSLEPFLAPDDEVVVVDQDSQAGQLEGIRARHPRVHVQAIAENRGFAAGVNLAARQTSAAHMLLINPDAVMEGPVVRELERWLEQHPDVGVAGPRVLDWDGRVQPSARRFPSWSAALGGRSTWLTARFPKNWFSRRHLIGRDANTPVDADWIAGSCLMTPRRVFEQVGGFDESFFLYWEDADYCRRVANLGLRRVLVPHVHVRHVGGRSAGRAQETSIRAFHDSAFRLYRKHARRLSLVGIPIALVGLWLRREWKLRKAARTR